jgi:phosphopantetheine adenylyltransferase
MAILKQEKSRTKNQIYELVRRVNLLKKFEFDFPNAEIEEVQAFISFVDHTDLTYKEICDKIK